MHGDGADGLRPAAVSLDAAALGAATLGFHRAFPRRSAKRVLHVTQGLALLALGAGVIWATLTFTAFTLTALHLAALSVFAIAIAWRLIAAACLTPTLSRLAAPARWPTYTLLCPLYREANVVADLVSALERIDYPGLVHQRSKARCARPLHIGACNARDYLGGSASRTPS